MQLATVRPPPAVQAAFNEVNQAQQEKQTAINQAWAIYNDAVPNARGQAKERQETSGGLCLSPGESGQGRRGEVHLAADRISQSARDHPATALFRIDAIHPSRTSNAKIVVDESVKGILQTLPLQPDAAHRSREAMPNDTAAQRSIGPTSRLALSAFVQSPRWRSSVWSFLFTALKWGALLFTVHQYETAIVTRFGKAIRVEKTPGLKVQAPVRRCPCIALIIASWPGTGRRPNARPKTNFT